MNRISFSIALTLTLLTAPAFATDFAFSPGGMCQVIFQSDAELEAITGTTNSVTGGFSLDLANPGAATGTVSIEAATFQSGIDMRDEHMLGEQWLDTENYPTIDFELIGVMVEEGAVLAHATPIAATLYGTLTLRGVTQPISVPVEATYYEIDAAAGEMPIDNNAIRVIGSFDVPLADYGITVPPVLDLKIADVLSIELRLTGIQQ